MNRRSFLSLLSLAPFAAGCAKLVPALAAQAPKSVTVTEAVLRDPGAVPRTSEPNLILAGPEGYDLEHAVPIHPFDVSELFDGGKYRTFPDVEFTLQHPDHFKFHGLWYRQTIDVPYHDTPFTRSLA